MRLHKDVSNAATDSAPSLKSVSGGRHAPPLLTQTTQHTLAHSSTVSGSANLRWQANGWRHISRKALAQAVDKFQKHPFVRWPMRHLAAFKKWARPWCLRTVEGVTFQCTMFMVTVYALVGDDIRMSASEASADLAFNIVTIVTLALFTFELIASCIGKEDYFLSFFFFLDLVATASLILDITWVYENIVLGGDTSMARAGRMSRVGTRAGRVIRVIRLIRLIRIIKLYRHVIDVANRLRGNQTEQSSRPGNETMEEVYAESRVAQKLSHMMTQKVILLILSMLLCLPMFTVEQWFQDVNTSLQYGADLLGRSYAECSRVTERAALAEAAGGGTGLAASQLNASCLGFEQQLTMYIGQHHQQNARTCRGSSNEAFNDECKIGLGWIGFGKDGFSFQGFTHKLFQEHFAYLFSDAALGVETLPSDLIVRLNAGGVNLDCESGDFYFVSLTGDPDTPCPSDIRLTERSAVQPNAVVAGYTNILFVIDLRPWSHRTAIFSIMQTVFICCVLAAGAMVFSHDANTLVLQPIERMIAVVRRIRDNPLHAMKLGDDNNREDEEEEEVKKSKKKSFTFCPCRQSQRRQEEALETKILENAIVKLGKLLALGFGEAGSEIIVKNMGDDSATVNAMIPGNKVEGVFGFCDILHFTDTTEVLQDKVMVFVNSVAEIVHDIVDEWHGAPNRNNGQAFLMVWRLREGQDPPEVITKVCDMAVMSFVHVLSSVNRSAVLKEYSEHPALLARISNYRVRMGFGLHSGWAIEGAIGSDFKIDASYLSPHVNMTGELEALTKLYQVSLLVSDALVKRCSEAMNPYFRAIDHVILKGVTSHPMRLFVVDLFGEDLEGTYYPRVQGGENPHELRLQREKAKEQKMQMSFEVHKDFERDPHIVRMRRTFTKAFYQKFSKGFFNYEAGEWKVARQAFEVTHRMISPPDGPSKALLDYMAEFDFNALRATPKGWPGYRELRA